jgi:hypothetical protein
VGSGGGGAWRAPRGALSAAGMSGCRWCSQGSMSGEGSGMVNCYVGRPGKDGKWARTKKKISNSNFKPIQLVKA